MVSVKIISPGLICLKISRSPDPQETKIRESASPQKMSSASPDIFSSEIIFNEFALN